MTRPESPIQDLSHTTSIEIQSKRALVRLTGSQWVVSGIGRLSTQSSLWSSQGPLCRSHHSTTDPLDRAQCGWSPQEALSATSVVPNDGYPSSTPKIAQWSSQSPVLDISGDSVRGYRGDVVISTDCSHTPGRSSSPLMGSFSFRHILDIRTLLKPSRQCWVV